MLLDHFGGIQRPRISIKARSLMLANFGGASFCWWAFRIPTVLLAESPSHSKAQGRGFCAITFRGSLILGGR